jgi:hypothetical protein
MQYEPRARRGETQKYNRGVSYRFVLKHGMDILISIPLTSAIVFGNYKM